MKNIYKMSGRKQIGDGTRLYCYVEADNMDDAFRISRSTFGERVITTAQCLAHNERMDKTLPFFTERVDEQEGNHG